MNKNDNDKWLDIEKITEIKDVLGDSFGDVITVFFTDAVKRLESINTALEKQDAESLRHSAHALKGSSSNIGAIYYAHICNIVELAAKDGRFNDAKEPILELNQYFPLVKSEIEKFLSDSV